MLAELSNFLLILALASNILQIFSYIINIKQPNIINLCFLQSSFIFLSYIGLIFCFITNDFTVLYVANNSNSSLPLFYKISAAWSAHEGSLLLWCLMLSGWTTLIAINKQKIGLIFLNKVIFILSIINAAFLLFIIASSNPFIRIIEEMVIDGNDLNPLLQDFALIIHPPILYMGYTGFVVPFAIAVAVLCTKIKHNIINVWASYIKPWILLPWIFLTIGIILGSWWAYYELGWGGWWAWDPVENVSFMPWLAGIALIHANIIAIKQKKLYSLCLLLCIINFCLSLIGGFLVRSGILSSIHSFATDPERGMYILFFIFIVIGGSLLLHAKRSNNFTPKTTFYITSREGYLLLNTSMLLVITAGVLFGTLYPLFYEIVTQQKISVGAPYFNCIFIILFIPVLLLIIPGEYARWSIKNPMYNNKIILYGITSLMFAYVFLYFNFRKINFYCLVFVWAAMAIILSTLRLGLDKNKIPMVLGHLGVAFTIVGITVLSSYEQENDLRLKIGDQINLNKYTIAFANEKLLEGPNYVSHQGVFTIKKNNVLINTLFPDKRIYVVPDISMSETAIDVGIFRDIYITMAQRFADGTWACRVYYKPFIRWIWLGFLLMASGGLIAVIKHRRDKDALP
jgi:cytochrome c-type biogenesis protein CcmF